MSQPRNARFAAAQRRLQVSELYLRGWSQAAIAAHLQVSAATVCGDLGNVRNEWRTSGIRNFDVLRETELQKLDLLEREAWAGWECSQKSTPSAVTTDEGNGEATRQSQRETQGDPRFLVQVHRCVAQRCKLLGLDAPLKVADVTPLIAESPERRSARLKEIFQSLVQESPRELPEVEPDESE